MRHSGIKLVHLLIHPLLGILAHLARELGISPRLGLVGVSCSKSALLGGVEASRKRDIAEILRSPRGISAPRLVPTRLKVTAPLGGSIQRDIPSPDVRLLVWQVRNKWPQLRGLLVLFVTLSE
jgi:hypothetical protein